MSEHQSSFRHRSRAALRSLFAVLFLALASVCLSANLTNQASVTLAWDRSPSDFGTNFVTYRVYAGTNLVSGNVVALTNAFAGTNTAVTFTNLAPATWYFYATASQAGLESTPSNMTSYSVPSQPPVAPGRFAVVYLENNAVLTVTNWNDLGLFRARIYIP